MEADKKPDEEKSKEDEKTLADLSSVHRCLKAKCQLVQTSHIKRINYFYLPFNEHLSNQA